LASSRVINAGNSHVENAANSYEMSSGENDQQAYSTLHDQSEASAPAQSSNATKPVVTNAGNNSREHPSASAPRSSLSETTLIDNDLYQ